ncbi:MAG: 7-carboxy-7-deazaguanine synthase QueE [Gammaproteobacteria bacterium]|nr:7-carboxy-7-deazaguanine synthase QueE [Gammaproteobacteria bacterium]
MTSSPTRRRDSIPAAERLRITEIFFSLQGEARTVGWPTVFVRLTGCPLRCVYCDTEYAFYGGHWMSMDDILAEVAKYEPRFVTVTGGEPLAQKNCKPLLTRLCDTGYEVSVETGGAMDVSGLDARVIRVMDLKTPGSGESERNHLDNITALRKQDQVKFVICSRDDYEWSKKMLTEHRLADRCEVLFSPSHGQVDKKALAEWILEDRLPVRFQIQLHKHLWNDEPGH